jgi:alkylation response protein AidB-like acyl-CoA dehydrogenase
MIRHPSDAQLQTLALSLRELSQSKTDWPTQQLKQCGEAGFYRWFVSDGVGGFGWSSADIARGYLELGAACLTTTFILTQRIAALKRIAGCSNEALRRSMLPKLLDGSVTATVGISHLTTSRQHLKKPALFARQESDGFRVNGFSPWVTGGCGADFILMGAQLESESGEMSDEQILFVVRTDAAGVQVAPGQALLALSSSQTGPVHCDNVFVPHESLVAGPIENVLVGNGGGAGGLQTSVLALSLVKAALGFISDEATRRPEIVDSQEGLRAQYERLIEQLFSAAEGNDAAAAAEIRSQANSLALRATQAALVVAKGAGFVDGHPVGRWCKEAMFFLVWSCPQSVAQANLNEFALCSIE